MHARLRGPLEYNFASECGIGFGILEEDEGVGCRRISIS